MSSPLCTNTQYNEQQITLCPNDGLITKIIAKDGTVIIKRISPITNQYIVAVFNYKYDSYTLSFSNTQDTEYCYDRLVTKHNMIQQQKDIDEVTNFDDDNESLVLSRSYSKRTASNSSIMSTSTSVANSPLVLKIKRIKPDFGSITNMSP